MICREMIERLLEAEPAELAGRGGGAVAEHVRSCARCRAAAERLLDAQAALAAELTAAPRLAVDEAVEKVLAGAVGQPPAPETARVGGGGPAGSGTAGEGGGDPFASPFRPGVRPASAAPPGWGNHGGTAGGGVRRGRRVLRTLAPLAAAAAVALLLVRHDVPPPGSPGAPRAPGLAPAPARTPAVIAPAGRNAALFRTSDPRITVVWIY